MPDRTLRKSGDMEFLELWYTPAVKNAYMIASLAHAAVGQKRANGVTPYIVHPERVARLTYDFSESGLSADRMVDRIVGALLHDVIEDTKLNLGHLAYHGVGPKALDIVLRLTKPDPHGKAPASYYEEIAANPDALVVKCADRCANLEDALDELLVEEPTEPRRWGRYVEDTTLHVLPLYATLPKLRKEIEDRLAKIQEALPSALERRASVVQRQRSKIENGSNRTQSDSQSRDASHHG